MKASEMTNEELAKQLDITANALPSFGGDETAGIVEEAAARLRKQDKQKQINKELVDENDDLRAKLKVAEDALKWCLEQANEIGEASLGEIDSCALSMSMAGCVRRCEQALAAIREEGGAK